MSRSTTPAPAPVTPIAKRHWLRPPLVTAPSPEDPSKQVTYAISEHYTYQLNAQRRLTPIFQLWAHVVGELPPINNVSRIERGQIKTTLTTLHDSTACFRGVMRPYDDEDQGESVLIYVIDPLVSIAYSAPDMVCLAKAAMAPIGTVLTVQVRPMKPLQDGTDSLHTGVVTRLEMVKADQGKPRLPLRHAQRYQTQLW